MPRASTTALLITACGLVAVMTMAAFRSALPDAPAVDTRPGGAARPAGALNNFELNSAAVRPLATLGSGTGGSTVTPIATTGTTTMAPTTFVRGR